MPSLFVSYSRAQLPLAESLALSLIESGVSVWFDLLALTPGRDWRADIDAGIDGATACALVASAESLASRAVAKEIARAVDIGKPLYVLVIDAVPLHLHHAPGLDLVARARGIIDFSGAFRPAVDRLVAALTTGAAVHDALPARSRTGFPTRMARAVAEVAATFPGQLVPLAMAFGGAAVGLEPRADTLIMFSVAVAAMVCLYGLVTYLRRRSDVTQVVSVQFTVAVTAGASLWPLRSTLPPGAAIGGITMSAILFLWAAWRVGTSEDLMRWFPAIDGPDLNPTRGRQIDRVQAVVEALRQQSPSPVDGRHYRFRIIHCPDDARIAAKLNAALVSPLSSEWTPGCPPPSVEPVLDILLLTNRLQPSEVDAFLAGADGIRVVALATPVALPASLEDALGRLQWLEFRGLLSSQVGFFLQSLRAWAPSRFLYATNHRPFQPSVPVGPLGTSQATTGLESLAAFGLSVGLIALVDGESDRQWLITVTAALQFGLVFALYRRALPFAAFVAVFLASVGAAWWQEVPRALAEATSNALVPSLTPWVVEVLFLVTVAWTLVSLSQARTWFPLGFARPSALGGLALSSIARRQALYVAGAIAMALYSRLAN